MNVYEEAHNLARAIKESNEFKDFDRLRKAAEADEQLSGMLEEFQKLQLEMQAAQMRGESMNPEIVSRTQSLYGMLMSKPGAAEYMQATMRFSIMMKDVSEILADAMNIKLSL